LEFVRLPLPLLRVGRERFFERNIWPDFREFRIQRQPFLKPRLGVRLDRVNRAFRLADPAIDAFVRVDHEHVLALVEAIHGAHLDAVHGFAANAALIDDVGQLSILSADRSGDSYLLRKAAQYQEQEDRKEAHVVVILYDRQLGHNEEISSGLFGFLHNVTISAKHDRQI
jgi:hypothetical protein